jgi:3-dehydroquinate synthetase
MSDYVSNIKENWFQFPTLTPISGDPTYKNLANLTQECKSNRKTVMSTLGGGNQGDLGMITSAAAYTRIAPGTPFI